MCGGVTFIVTTRIRLQVVILSYKDQFLSCFFLRGHHTLDRERECTWPETREWCGIMYNQTLSYVNSRQKKRQGSGISREDGWIFRGHFRYPFQMSLFSGGSLVDPFLPRTHTCCGRPPPVPW